MTGPNAWVDPLADAVRARFSAAFGPDGPRADVAAIAEDLLGLAVIEAWSMPTVRVGFWLVPLLLSHQDLLDRFVESEDSVPDTPWTLRVESGGLMATSDIDDLLSPSNQPPEVSAGSDYSSLFNWLMLEFEVIEELLKRERLDPDFALDQSLLQFEDASCQLKVASRKLLVQDRLRVLNPTRRTFALAHAIGHLVLHTEPGGPAEFRCRAHIDAPVSLGERSPLHEREADRFASALLMPRDRITAALSQGGAPRDLSALFGVTQPAMAARLIDLEITPGSLRR